MGSDLLYPVCPNCGATDGISKVTVGPESPDGYHDVSGLLLACGHEPDPVDVDGPDRLSSTVVDLIQTDRPDVIELADQDDGRDGAEAGGGDGA